MENETKKYVITIDGTDCTGKTTLWKKANTNNKKIQIRGIVSNIAYAIKYKRNIDELIELYNQNPVNYVVYLLNPINDKKLEMLYNRCRNVIYNNDRIVKELKDASDTWKDYQYFEQAIDLLKEKYKGDLDVIISSDNDLDNFEEKIKNYELYELDDITPNPGIRVIQSTIDEFEERAKEISEFKYVVLINVKSIEDIIDNLYNGLDDTYKDMFDTLMDLTDKTVKEIYEELDGETVDDLVDYLDNYELEARVNAEVTVESSLDVRISLADAARNRDSLEEVIYDDSYIMDDVIDSLKDELHYADIEVNVDRIY